MVDVVEEEFIGSGGSRRMPDRWHVGKEVPIALIFALFVQTGGWIWWAATQSAKLDTLTAMISEFRAQQYTQRDAVRDLENTGLRIKELERRVIVLEERAPRGSR